VSARLQIQASSFNRVAGLQTEVTADSLGGYDLGYADGGDYAVYRQVDFDLGLKGVEVRVASAGSGGILEFHLDGPTGHLIGAVRIPVTGGWQDWETMSGPVSGATGIRDLYAVFKGSTNIGNVNWFRFTPGFLRGDSNLDGVVDVSDAVGSLLMLFAGKTATCLDSLDANDDGAVNLSDPLYLLNHLFRQGPAPPPPGLSACGMDPTPDALGCLATGPCP